MMPPDATRAYHDNALLPLVHAQIIANDCAAGKTSSIIPTRQGTFSFQRSRRRFQTF